MRFISSLILGLVVLLLMVGCFSGGGGPKGGGTDYDGVWKVTYADSSAKTFTPGADQAVVCDKPAVPMTVVNGAGSTMQTNTCWAISTASGVAGTIIPNTTVGYYSLISVYITSDLSGDILNAQVDGSSLTGKCIPNGCTAHTGTGGLTMIR